MCRNYGGFFPIFFLLIVSTRSFAQCKQFPADCPSDRQLPDSADRFGNPVIPAEVSMEISLHDFFTDLQQLQADKKGWQLYQYDETAGSGYLKADRSGPLAPEFRPPHNYEISFIVIVNQDSMHAWQQWDKDSKESLMAEVEKMKSTGDFSPASKMQASRKINMERFRNASMIRVKYEVNPGDAIASSITENMHRSATLNVPHAAVAFQMHNDQLDEQGIFDLNQFTRCSDLAFLLFGDWNIKPDNYQYYRPAYNADKKNIDMVTPKSIFSTRVRTIAVHVEGSPYYINQFLQSLDSNKLSGIIVR